MEGANGLGTNGGGGGYLPMVHDSETRFMV